MSDDSALTLTVAGTAYTGWAEIRVSRGIDRFCADFDIQVSERRASGEAPKSWQIPLWSPCTISIGADLILFDRSLMIPICRPKAPAPSRRGRKLLHFLNLNHRDWRHNELGNFLSGINAKLLGAEINQKHAHFASIACVNCPWRIQHSHSVVQC